MDVFLMIRNQKTTIFLDCKENTSVGELKRMLEGILKVKPGDQRLLNQEGYIMEDNNPLSHYNISMSTAKGQAPAQLSLTLRKESGEFDSPDITPYSSPPDSLEVMKIKKQRQLRNNTRSLNYELNQTRKQ